MSSGSGWARSPRDRTDWSGRSATPADHVVEIRLAGPTGDDEVDLVAQHDGACPAGNTDAAGLVHEELREVPDDSEEVALASKTMTEPLQAMSS